MAADEEAVTLVLLDAMVQLRVVVLVALALLRVTPLGSNVVVPKVLPDALTLLRVALALLLPLVVHPVVLVAVVVRTPLRMHL